jgi:hypothetical protein
MPAPSLVIQTTYAELLERSAATSFSDAFPEDGSFTCKTINGRRYWYFQTGTSEGRSQRYAGPESPELLELITDHKQARDDERERRALVSTLVRSFGFTPPIKQIGEVLAELAKAGVFRLRSVLIGTVAYQCYPPMLGAKLPNSLLQTNDIDIAQFTNVSIAMGDQTQPMLKVLKDVDRTFREIPHTAGHRFTTSYMAKGGLRVDFVTPNEGPDTDAPQSLPALKTDAQPLRFLDFLIHEPVHAVILHGPGLYVQVPAPERYAVHKLILALDRPAGVSKRDKDLSQAAALIRTLAEKRPDELKHAWEEAHGRGPKWRKLLLEGMRWLAPPARDILLKTLGRARAILPGIDLTFNSSPVHYDSSRDIATFAGEALGHPVECAISREALEDHFGADNVGKSGRVEVFLRHRSKIENLTRLKYLSRPVEEPEAVLLRTTDIEGLSEPPV